MTASVRGGNHHRRQRRQRSDHAPVGERCPPSAPVRDRGAERTDGKWGCECMRSDWSHGVGRESHLAEMEGRGALWPKASSWVQRRPAQTWRLMTKLSHSTANRTQHTPHKGASSQCQRGREATHRERGEVLGAGEWKRGASLGLSVTTRTGRVYGAVARAETGAPTEVLRDPGSSRGRGRRVSGVGGG